MLDRLEVYNFKSYRGHQTIGPFRTFTAVIGPNGAGKSNLMDAISFVLGVRSSSLRSSALKDLIYRSGKTGKEKMKRGRDAENEEDEGGDQEEDDQDDVPQPELESDEEAVGERRAWVRAVYIHQNEVEWHFQRSISMAGVSEYRVNNRVVTFKKYNDTLENFNILVKAKNFLVFQGDVEQVASQSPQDLAKLIDQISGSLDLKEEYDRAASALEKATELSMLQHTRRKGVNVEIKQYKELKKEAERWKSLNAEKEMAVVLHAVWKLFHISSGIESNVGDIQEKSKLLAEYRQAHAKSEEELKNAKKEASKAIKEAGKQEKQVISREKDLEALQPDLVSIDARIVHANKKLKSAESHAKAVEHDLAAGETKLSGLKTDLAAVRKASQRHKDAQLAAARSKGLALSDEDVQEYRQIKIQASSKAVAEREVLVSLQREEKTKRDALDAAQDALQVSDRKLGKLLAENVVLTEKKQSLDTKAAEITQSLKKTEQEHADMQARKTQTAQTEQELNEKLAECYNKLLDAGADKQESEREAKFKEVLANLKRTFPGVRGRVIDLCKPTQNKYSLAVTTVLGKNIDSVVVDSEKTAIDCIEYMRSQRAGQATFIPLETIQAKPVNDKYRSYAKGARLAIDVIAYESRDERALQHACGNALVCDTMDIARHVVYDKGQDVKAVTLDGTIIHKSGLITGGTSTHGQSRHFEAREIDGLRRRENELRVKLQDILKNRPRSNVEEALTAEIGRLRSEKAILEDDLLVTNDRLKGVQSEIKVLKKAAETLDKEVQKVTGALQKLEQQAQAYQRTINAEEDKLFSAFARRIKVANIREYEQKQLKGAQEDNAATLKFDTQTARLSNQINFEQQQVDNTRRRLDVLIAAAETERKALVQLSINKSAKENELEQIQDEIRHLKNILDQLNATVGEKNVATEEVRSRASKTAKVLEKAMKEIAACNDNIERLGSERLAIYRKCRLEDIKLPLRKGSLEKIPMDASLPSNGDNMEIDGENGVPPRIAQIPEYGVVVDFEQLDDDVKENGSAAMEEELLRSLNVLQSEIDKMSPNLKAIERLGDSESRFREIDGEFEQAREAAKEAKDAFTAIKKQRCTLFNKAYAYISDRIDSVYKDLTMGKAAPLGGVAYLSLEDSEEPYLHGIKYHAMPPMKRFRDMDQLSGGEKTMAALALLFAIHSFQPSPFFVLDEVDAALDNTNVSRIARYVKRLANPEFQFIVISLKPAFFEKAGALVGIYREGGTKTLTLDLDKYAE